MLKGKTVVVAVTGGIAAYKAANVVSALVKARADVYTLMTAHATEFISPLVFETLTSNPCFLDTHDDRLVGKSVHVHLGSIADAYVVVPATADVIGKAAMGLADDIVTTTLLSMECPILVAPAMNTAMFENRAVQDGINTLRQRGVVVIPPAIGRLACGAMGAGKLPDESVIVDAILHEIALPHDLTGKHILVTAGPTQEALDPVRYITNHSTGRMGYAIARNASLRGAKVTLVSGPVSIPAPSYCTLVPVVSAQDMFESVTAFAPKCDAIIKAAAVADFTPAEVAPEKIKKTGQGSAFDDLEFVRTPDILAWLGAHRVAGQRICGFSMETTDMIANSQSKLERKGVDMIAANSLRESGAGFGTSTNHVTLLTYLGDIIDIPLASKDDVAHELLTQLFALEPRAF